MDRALSQVAELQAGGQGRSWALRSRRIVTPGAVVDGYVIVRDETLAEIGPGPIPARWAELASEDAGDQLVIPGLVDVHVHGMCGASARSSEPDEHLAMAAGLQRHGVTTYLPTVASTTPATMGRVLGAVAEAQRLQAGNQTRPRGASIVGLHLEGPFLNPRCAGAMDSATFLPPSADVLAGLAPSALSALSRVTLAPELPGALEVIGVLARLGITVCGGHTAASYEQTMAGIDAGITMATHLFNAMAPFRHREPGPVAAYLTDPRVTCELIADGVHVHPAALRLAFEATGGARVAMVSDAVALAGLRPGTYDLFGSPAVLGADGTCRRGDGTLAGSGAPPVAGLRTLVDVARVPLLDAVRAAATTPARSAGLSWRTGALRTGLAADLLVIGADWELRAVVQAGSVVPAEDLSAGPWGQDRTSFD